MKIIYRWLVIVVIFFPLTATSQDSYEITGQVVDINNNPVNGAVVTAGDKTYTTMDDGVYILEGVKKENTLIQVKVGDITNEEPIDVQNGGSVNKKIQLEGFEKVEFRTSADIPNELMPMDGVAKHASVRPSHSNQIAVELLSPESKNFNIYLMDTTTHSLTPLVSGDQDEGFPRWSPDGMKLAFHSSKKNSGYKVWIMDMETGKQTLVDRGMTPAWSPSGEEIVYSKSIGNNWDIYKQNLKKHRSIRLTSGVSREQYPYWGKISGKETIVYASTKNSEHIYEIWRMNTDGTGQKQLSNVGRETGHRMVGPVISPDGSQIAFWEVNYQPDHSVWVMDSDGRNQKRLINYAANPEWYPADQGGSKLLFNSKQTGRSQIWTTNLSD